MSRRFSGDFLRALRNDISIDELIRMSSELPSKEREGFLRFLCPLCGDFHTATNPKTNLARCFRCRKNFNPIDLVMAVKACRFTEAVDLLAPLLKAAAGRPTPSAEREETP